MIRALKGHYEALLVTLVTICLFGRRAYYSHYTDLSIKKSIVVPVVVVPVPVVVVALVCIAYYPYLQNK